jgi:hypothetical protein
LQALVVIAVTVGVLIIKAVISMLVPDVPASVLIDMRKEKWIASELRRMLEARHEAALAAATASLRASASPATQAQPASLPVALARAGAAAAALKREM